MDRDIITILAKHLVPGGILYIDNKLGIGAHYKERGNVLQKRWFRYRTVEELDAGPSARASSGLILTGTTGLMALTRGSGC